MLQIITAQVEFTQPGQGPPAGQEKQVIFAQSSVFEVHVDESLSYPVKYDRQTIAYVAVAQVQSTQQRQSLHTYIRRARLEASVRLSWLRAVLKVEKRSV